MKLWDNFKYSLMTPEGKRMFDAIQKSAGRIDYEDMDDCDWDYPIDPSFELVCNNECGVPINVVVYPHGCFIINDMCFTAGSNYLYKMVRDRKHKQGYADVIEYDAEKMAEFDNIMKNCNPPTTTDEE